MSIRDRLQRWGESNTTAAEQVLIMEDNSKLEKSSYHELKSRIHQKLLDRVDLSVMEKLPSDRLINEIKDLVEQLLNEEKIPINLAERGNLVSDIQHEILGLGPLEPLLADPTISDILVNTYNQVYVERRGKLELTDAHFADNRHLLRIIDRIVSRIGRRVDESSPMVDARLSDGSRVNAIIPPLALDGPILSIRRFPFSPLKIEDLIRYKSLTPAMAEVIAGLVKSKCNLLISGGTGSGKTTAQYYVRIYSGI